MDYSDAKFPKPGKKKKGPAKRKPRPANLTKRLDALVRKIVRARDQGCVTPDKNCSGSLEVSHFIGRSNYALRWDLRNCNLQCNWHNRYHDKDREPYRKFLAKKYGEGIFDEFSEITAHWYATGGSSGARKEAIYENLQEIWKEYKDGMH